MTMLDRMRRHSNWLKWSLALVCLSFVLFYIPDFLRGASGVDLAATDTVAVVNGHEIRADEFRRTYQAQMQAYRGAYGGQMSEQLLKQLGIDQQILQQLVDERAALAEAERVGLKVSDAEVAQRIYAIPAFQENGAFIGQSRYQQLLASQSPPLSTSDFEEGIRRSLVMEKLRASVTDWLSVSDKELQDEYKRRNDKIKLAVVAFNADSYRPDVSASDADVASYFEGHQADFRIPEKRKVKYVLVDIDALRTKVVISPADLTKAYNDNAQQYTTPEQVRASHVLLKTEGKDDAAVKARAEEVLKEARGGADFAELAKKYSEDDSNSKNGGDLDYFGRGRMVPEFDAAAFAMEVGQISDVVKTQFGYHIIKLTDKKPGVTRPLEEVKQQLTDQLQSERAQQQAGDIAQKLETQIKKPADLETAARAEGLTVQETGFFAKDEPILGVGAAPEMTARAFTLNDGEVSPALRTGRGFVFETVTGKQDSYIPKLDEVKDKVRDVVLKQRAVEFAKQRAAEVAAKLKDAPDFDKAAKAANVEPKTTELITRDAPLPELGVAPDIMAAVFKLPQGGVSDVLSTANGAAVVRVVEKAETTDADFTSNKDTFRTEILDDRRNRFFSAYMVKAKQKMKIDVNREAIARVIG
ncbi:MAG TPA: peptidyl-prolyl cis-trans isomerase [Vicinamibacterales bacterium]|nr:peptidyl-prolyl cis-trans isomerase [Vicinamibacterales bacterium]